MEGSNCKDRKESINCGGCLNKIGDDDHITALEQEWHRDCFRCSVCDSLLSSWYCEKAGLLFCRDDYWARFGDDCHHCKQVTSDGEPCEERHDRRRAAALYCGTCCDERGAPDAALPALPVLHPAADFAVTKACPCSRASGAARAVLRRALALALCDPSACRRGEGRRGASEGRAGDCGVQITVETDLEKNIPKYKPQTENDNNHIPKMHSIDVDQRKSDDAGCEVVLRRDRLFKRKGESGGRNRVIKRRQTPSSPLLGEKERSSSMSKLVDAVEGGEGEGSEEGALGVLGELSRARSFRAPDSDVPDHHHQVFRPNDLVQGELLGAGFFGQVYKVTHRETGEVMVLKQLYRLDEHAQRNFLKEVAVLRSLRHPNVLKFMGVVYSDKRLHLVTEYVAGGTLHDLLQSGTALGWAARARLARDVAAGVHYLHRTNLIHRDLNSHNCLVREDETVVVADFGLARIVRREAATPGTLRRKRYTVVGNPYWMAPEMMNGDEYDESVDVFSFGIIICEIIGRVSADPDELPRRSDFGLHEARFRELFCRRAPQPPEPLVRLALRACDLHPDLRPRFDVIEQWLQRLVEHLTTDDKAALQTLLEDVDAFTREAALPSEPEPAPRLPEVGDEKDQNETGGVVKSGSNAAMLERVGLGPGALGKCVSAGHLAEGAGGARGRTVTLTDLSRSALALAPGFILRDHGDHINITKVADIRAWLEPVPLRRSSPSPQLHRLQQPVPAGLPDPLPSFLRNQSVEGLETHAKIDAPVPFCRHYSIPDNCEDSDSESDSSSDAGDIGAWYRNVSSFRKLDKSDLDKKSILGNIVKKGENLLAKKSSYNVSDVILRNPECLKGERRVPEVDCRRFNIEHFAGDRLMAEGIRNIPKYIEHQKADKPGEKSGFFTKKLLSPKLSRLFKPNVPEVNKHEVSDEEKSKSKFFIHRPASGSNMCRSHRVRPLDGDTKSAHKEHNTPKADIKVPSMGKPVTPTFRRHLQNERPDFADGRFSCRERRPKCEIKEQEFSRNRLNRSVNDKVKLVRSNHTSHMLDLNIKEKREKETMPRTGISRSNYVSLANLKINGKGKELQEKGREGRETTPVERVI